jgi:hypothetical protein
MIQAGCVVFHKPTKEEWFVLGVESKGERLCVGGFPPTIAHISDCQLVEPKKRELSEDEIQYRKNTFGSSWV